MAQAASEPSNHRDACSGTTRRTIFLLQYENETPVRCELARFFQYTFPTLGRKIRAASMLNVMPQRNLQQGLSSFRTATEVIGRARLAYSIGRAREAPRSP